MFYFWFLFAAFLLLSWIDLFAHYPETSRTDWCGWTKTLDVGTCWTEEKQWFHWLLFCINLAVHGECFHCSLPEHSLCSQFNDAHLGNLAIASRRVLEAKPWSLYWRAPRHPAFVVEPGPDSVLEPGVLCIESSRSGALSPEYITVVQYHAPAPPTYIISLKSAAHSWASDSTVKNYWKFLQK